MRGFRCARCGQPGTLTWRGELIRRLHWVRAIPRGQTWFWTRCWQAREAEAEAEIRAGLAVPFDMVSLRADALSDPPTCEHGRTSSHAVNFPRLDGGSFLRWLALTLTRQSDWWCILEVEGASES